MFKIKLIIIRKNLNPITYVVYGVDQLSCLCVPCLEAFPI